MLNLATRTMTSATVDMMLALRILIQSNMTYRDLGRVSLLPEAIHMQCTADKVIKSSIQIHTYVMTMDKLPDSNMQILLIFCLKCQNKSFLLAVGDVYTSVFYSTCHCNSKILRIGTRQLC